MSKLVGISGVSGCGCDGVGKVYTVSTAEIPGVTTGAKAQLDLPVQEIAADVMAATRVERLAVTAGLAAVLIGGLWLVTKK
jgi:hypothetical protein